MNKRLIWGILVISFLALSCKEKRIMRPENMVSQPLGAATLYRDTTSSDNDGSLVVWTERQEQYIQAYGWEFPVMRLSKDIEPETLQDLLERLVYEKLPLEITAERKVWGNNRAPAEQRVSSGDLVKETFDFAVKGTDTLRLDVYRQSSTDKPRPILLYSFGGGWQSGSRASVDNPLFPFLSAFARLGYVVVSIDYRLGYSAAQARGEVPDGDAAYIMAASKGTEWEKDLVKVLHKACLDATEDLFDATSFVVAHAEEWGGDAARIVLCGSSAGACNSLMAEYLLANEDRLALEHLPDAFRYGGIVPCAGAIFTEGEPPVWKRKPSPIFFLHGDADPVVPYESGYHFYGPRAIIDSLPEETPFVLYTSAGADHSMCAIPTGYMNHAIAAFIERYVVQGAQSSLNVQERFISSDGPLVKHYLLSGYFYPREEVLKWFKLVFPDAI